MALRATGAKRLICSQVPHLTGGLLPILHSPTSWRTPASSHPICGRRPCRALVLPWTHRNHTATSTSTSSRATATRFAFPSRHHPYAEKGHAVHWCLLGQQDPHRQQHQQQSDGYEIISAPPHLRKKAMPCTGAFLDTQDPHRQQHQQQQSDGCELRDGNTCASSPKPDRATAGAPTALPPQPASAPSYADHADLGLLLTTIISTSTSAIMASTSFMPPHLQRKAMPCTSASASYAKPACATTGAPTASQPASASSYAELTPPDSPHTESEKLLANLHLASLEDTSATLYEIEDKPEDENEDEDDNYSTDNEFVSGTDSDDDDGF
ncbi:uncharacterized protein RCC_07609 [Ramularia collo-cygni]|uniref:Uncharacterized protein n=1 Tax=Ramularia collo-cygni TaxID=112498 RepID=A0A2D3VFT0_9PEZI|nr:uncharacterized protein RCC_07609 [Ramularia collo-cygni]CZT21744.1 uncharacterized protein RCC_07609 [Ramularia collo-cygni]